MDRPRSPSPVRVADAYRDIVADPRAREEEVELALARETARIEAKITELRLPDDAETRPGQRECVVCMTNARTVLTVCNDTIDPPVNHFNMCSRCAVRTIMFSNKKCPTCRATISYRKLIAVEPGRRINSAGRSLSR